jgi:hypothetical protein
MEEYDENDNYINRNIMMPNKDGKHNSFYRVVRSTNKMFCLRRLKCATTMLRPTTFEVKISNEYEDEKERRIRKANIVKYQWIYCSIVQYEIHP